MSNVHYVVYPWWPSLSAKSKLIFFTKMHINIFLWMRYMSMKNSMHVHVCSYRTCKINVTYMYLYRCTYPSSQWLLSLGKITCDCLLSTNWLYMHLRLAILVYVHYLTQQRRWLNHRNSEFHPYGLVTALAKSLQTVTAVYYYTQYHLDWPVEDLYDKSDSKIVHTILASDMNTCNRWHGHNNPRHIFRCPRGRLDRNCLTPFLIRLKRTQISMQYFIK